MSHDLQSCAHVCQVITCTVPFGTFARRAKSSYVLESRCVNVRVAMHDDKMCHHAPLLQEFRTCLKRFLTKFGKKGGILLNFK